jgi:hypothetical protein
MGSCADWPDIFSASNNSSQGRQHASTVRTAAFQRGICFIDHVDTVAAVAACKPHEIRFLRRSQRPAQCEEGWLAGRPARRHTGRCYMGRSKPETFDPGPRSLCGEGLTEIRLFAKVMSRLAAAVAARRSAQLPTQRGRLLATWRKGPPDTKSVADASLIPQPRRGPFAPPSGGQATVAGHRCGAGQQHGGQPGHASRETQSISRTK